jgi:uncharacterized protein YaaW (UPF0174 family)
MPNDLRWVAPSPQPIPEAIIVHEVTREFYREVKYRDEFEDYCQWYRAIAAKHQKEMQRMQKDINLLGWLYRARR